MTALGGRVAALLRRLEDDAGRRDPAVMERAYAAAAGRPAPPGPREAAELCADAALPVHPGVGRFLYQLVRTVRPALVVEFGTSFGISTIYLAAALRDNGTGRVVGSELHPGKAARAAAHLAEAGLADLVEIRVGDAAEELADLPEPVGVLLLDGWKELYLPVLRVLEPALRPGACVVSDNLPMLPPEFLEHVRGDGYVSQPLELGEGIEFSVRAG
ncbi:O-methyltransferase [Actinomadura sediminis]|uniref:O-methyltransferase n=1 Tax=Actinomadura sediminis TaxID=1038904 RepID=A0ABW3EJ70_9ACTN